MDAHALSLMLSQTCCGLNFCVLALTTLVSWLLQVVLSRYSSQDDIVVGTLFSMREAPWQDVVGCMINDLALRTDLSGEPSFKELVGRVTKTSLEAFDNGHVPFGKVVEALKLPRTASHKPVFQAMLNFKDRSDKLPGRLAAQDLDLEGSNGMTKFDMYLELAWEGDTIVGHTEYRTDLFDPATMERFAKHLQAILAGAVAAPDTSILKLPLLTPEEAAPGAASVQPQQQGVSKLGNHPPDVRAAGCCNSGRPLPAF